MTRSTEEQLEAARAALRWAVKEARGWLYDGHGQTLTIPPEHQTAIAEAERP